MSATTRGKGPRNKKATEPGKSSQEMPSPRHSNESQKRGTATKHAKRFVLHYNSEIQQFIEKELENRADDSTEALEFKLSGFLAHVARFNVFLSKLEINNEDIEDMIFEKIVDWSKNPRIDASYSHSELKLHKKLWSVVNTNKDGSSKDRDFVHWC